jgi:hypothetical protein
MSIRSRSERDRSERHPGGAGHPAVEPPARTATDKSLAAMSATEHFLCDYAVVTTPVPPEALLT